MKIGHAIANFFSGLWGDNLRPWLKDLLTHVSHDLADAAVPLATAAIQELLAGGEGVTLVSVAKSTALKAEAQGLQIAEHDLGVAVSGALASYHAASIVSS